MLYTALTSLSHQNYMTHPANHLIFSWHFALDQAQTSHIALAGLAAGWRVLSRLSPHNQLIISTYDVVRCWHVSGLCSYVVVIYKVNIIVHPQADIFVSSFQLQCNFYEYFSPVASTICYPQKIFITAIASIYIYYNSAGGLGVYTLYQNS